LNIFIFTGMSYWKLSDFWKKIAKVLKLLSTFMTVIFMIQPETHIYIWLTAPFTFFVEVIEIIFDDQDGDGISDIFQWKKKIKDIEGDN